MREMRGKGPFPTGAPWRGRTGKGKRQGVWLRRVRLTPTWQVVVFKTMPLTAHERLVNAQGLIFEEATHA